MARNVNIKQMKGQTGHQPMKWPFKDGLCIFMFCHFLLCLCNLSFWPPKHTLPDASLLSFLGYGISLFPVSLLWMWVFPSLKDSFWGRPLTLQSDNSGGTWSEIKMNAVCCGLRWFVQERMWASCLWEMWTIYFAAAASEPRPRGPQSSWGFCLPGQKTDFTEASGKESSTW